ncbi:NAD(+)/NADH kinase [Micromonospora sp. NBRC 101691]|uniref:NAD(+)/NADH kinase n=1 Tax=Micromonospora sp. NBRC 101691 TaxID=3032198 RepID=UPI0024A174A4|nr:NAD(+)/NADH kinase [Micromonospora sp. NBRC 101691]GLY22846.1 NAD kinase [Micromonospora sp. NBRC 101691]
MSRQTVGVTRVPTLGLVVHPSRTVGGSVSTILGWARTHSVRVVARDQDRDRIVPEVETVPDHRFVAQVDGVVALGGDGTMLGAMRLVVGHPVPVLGVNHGNLGFLVEITPDALEEALARLVGGDFTVESHSCLVAEHTGGTPLRTGTGFNDIVLARHGRTGTVSVDLTVNDQQYGYYRCDALVVATPSGSTAYNYAAGGPVVSPSARTMVITPVAPMAGIGRSVVLGAGDQVSLRVAPDSAPVAVDVDGTPSAELGPGRTLTVRLREDAGHVVRFSASRHVKRSQLKLSLLDLPLRRDQLLELIPEHLRPPSTGPDAV